MLQRRMRVALLGVVLVVGSAACDSNWRQMGFGPEHQRWNAAQAEITPDNVATLGPDWTAPYGNVDDEPIVDDGMAFVIHHDAGVATAFALDVDDGSVVWQQDIGSVSAEQPVLVGDELYGTWISGCATGEYRLDAATGAVVAIDETTPVLYGTAVPAGEQFVQYTFPTYGCTDADSTVVVRDSATGAVLWESVPVSGIGSLPVVAEGRVYVLHQGSLSAYDLAGCGGAGACPPLWTQSQPGSAAQHLFAEGTILTLVFNGGSPTIAAFDASSGDLVWFSATTTLGDMAYADGFVFVGGFGKVHAYAAGGCGSMECHPVWSGDTVSSPYPSGGVLAVGGDVLYVSESAARGGAAGTTVAFDADGCGSSTCPALWTSGGLSPAASGIAVADGHLFVAGYGGGPLRAFAPAPP